MIGALTVRSTVKDRTQFLLDDIEVTREQFEIAWRKRADRWGIPFSISCCGQERRFCGFLNGTRGVTVGAPEAWRCPVCGSVETY